MVTMKVLTPIEAAGGISEAIGADGFLKYPTAGDVFYRNGAAFGYDATTQSWVPIGSGEGGAVFPATASLLGGVKIGAGLSVETDGTLSVLPTVGNDPLNKPAQTEASYTPSGRLSSYSETVDGDVSVTEYVYNTNGSVHTATTTYRGTTVTETYFYNTNGSFDHSTLS